MCHTFTVFNSFSFSQSQSQCQFCFSGWAGWCQVNLRSARQIEWVAAEILKGSEVICNIDQNPNHVPHIGRFTPCVLASTTNMWSLLRSRPMTPCELLTAQQVPIYPDTARWAGFPEVPLSVKDCSLAAIRKMAGNSFNQTCSVAFVA